MKEKKKDVFFGISFSSILHVQSIAKSYQPYLLIITQIFTILHVYYQ